MFDFGENWRRYSTVALDAARVQAAREALIELVGQARVSGKRFLDVGCGSGIVAIAAAHCSAAEVVGIDISADAVEVSRKNATRYGPMGNTPSFQQCSILDRDRLAVLGQFGTVYAWGSLHHTGRMWDALANAASLVGAGGTLAVAIYNRHVTSPAWKVIKWSYNWSPRLIQRGMVYAAVPPIAAAKYAITRRNPWHKERGMDFYTDVIDWVGGYPYEYARPGEVVARVEALGFTLLKTVAGATPTACNEFVFQRTAE